ncbi:hypothetical protein TNCV_2959061 [Trichonephila clavipes]|nr:hypothetical protein TNCV_2959061 [Trichonephila clavipes]
MIPLFGPSSLFHCLLTALILLCIHCGPEDFRTVSARVLKKNAVILSLTLDDRDLLEKELELAFRSEAISPVKNSGHLAQKLYWCLGVCGGHTLPSFLGTMAAMAV